MSAKKNTLQHNSLNYLLNIDDEDMDKEILKPFTYHTTIPGKQIRNKLLKVLLHWISVPKHTLIKIDKIAYLMHNITLMLDDIEDSSILRRGVPAAHMVYGIPRTLLAVDWIESVHFGLLAELDNFELTKLFPKKIVEMTAGQGMELYWRDNYICPTEEEYIQMVYRKTSISLVLLQKTMNTFSTGQQVDASKFMIVLGIYMQINDDYQNLHNQVYYDSKGFCEDITEGKFSYPIVHAVNNFPKEGKEIIHILSQRTYDVELKRRCLSILEECGSFEYTRNKLQQLKSCVYAEIAKLAENPFIAAFIEEVM